MKQLLARCLCLLLVTIPNGCSVVDVLSPCPQDQVCVNGTARFFDFEGGFWAVRGDDDVTYDPLGGLPEDFRQEGLRVHLRARVRDDVGSFHMAGPIVDIVEIRTLR